MKSLASRVNEIILLLGINATVIGFVILPQFVSPQAVQLFFVLNLKLAAILAFISIVLHLSEIKSILK